MFCQQKKQKSVFPLLQGVGTPFPVGYVRFPSDIFSRFSDFYMCIVYVSCVCGSVQLLDYFRETLRTNRPKDERAGKGGIVIRSSE